MGSIVLQQTKPLPGQLPRPVPDGNSPMVPVVNFGKELVIGPYLGKWLRITPDKGKFTYKLVTPTMSTPLSNVAPKVVWYSGETLISFAGSYYRMDGTLWNKPTEVFIEGYNPDASTDDGPVSWSMKGMTDEQIAKAYRDEEKDTSILGQVKVFVADYFVWSVIVILLLVGILIVAKGSVSGTAKSVIGAVT